MIANSSDGGGSFEPGVVVDDGLIPPGRVMLIFTMPPAGLAVADDGAMYAAWHDAKWRLGRVPRKIDRSGPILAGSHQGQ